MRKSIILVIKRVGLLAIRPKDTGCSIKVTDLLSTSSALIRDASCQASRIWELVEGRMSTSDGNFTTSLAGKGQFVPMVFIYDSSVIKEGRGVYVIRATVIVAVSAFEEGFGLAEDVDALVVDTIAEVSRVAVAAGVST
jgi:hypothetical protein